MAGTALAQEGGSCEVNYRETNGCSVLSMKLKTTRSRSMPTSRNE
ncbi:hypothetical protein BT93_G0142 [Corymbia citriodora subsp. variegata]|nr:hypothetical protein BT93_G0142 [Corymbia citriodora subsp. variegata]